MFDGLFDNVITVLLLRKIAGQQQALPASGLDPACGLLRIFVFIEIGDGNVGTFAGIGNGYRPPNPAVSTGNQRNLAF
ncbi:hypothetical protein D3C76_1578580 [compost metagenome]